MSSAPDQRHERNAGRFFIVIHSCSDTNIMSRMRLRIVGCCVAAAATLSSCASGHASHPVSLTRIPAEPPSFGEYRLQTVGVVCRTRVLGAEYAGARKRTSSALLAVSRNVRGATAFWLPGGQGTPCHSVRTEITEPAAREIATLIDKARPFPAGTVNCGSDDGTQVWLYLRPRHTDRVQKVVLQPDGCLTVSASGLRPRYLPAAVMRMLAPYAPNGWTRYLHHGV
jgi:hypothetical protein